MLCFYLISCVQIIVESFPVSSSGHCYLLLSFLKTVESNCSNLIFHRGIYTPLFIESFDHALHLATLLVLTVFFFDRWKIYLLRFRLCFPLFFKVVGLTACADIITAFFYLFFKMYPVQWPVVVGFGITAMSLVSLYFIQKRESNSFNIRTALILGFVQGIALLPGISRLATTYAAARWLGLQPRKAFEVSWLIAVPLFLAASAQGIYKIAHMPQVYSLVLGSLPYIIGAGILAYGALKITAHLFYTQRAWWFGIYMIVPICLALKMFV